MISGVVSLLVAYLLGSIPTGYLLFRWKGGGDIRREGSGNIGATNVMRTGGKTIGILTFALDVAKGAMAVLAARAIAASPWDAAAAFASVAGHCFPVFLRFKGGKGIATGCGAYAVLAPIPMAVALAVFTAAAFLTRIVSVGSILAGLTLPLMILWLRPEPPLIASVAAAVILAIGRHHANIRRLVAGREHRIDGA